MKIKKSRGGSPVASGIRVLTAHQQARVTGGDASDGTTDNSRSGGGTPIHIRNDGPG